MEHTQAERDALMADINAAIAKSGYAVITNEGLENDESFPYAYTVGLSRFGLPELVIAGSYVIQFPLGQMLMRVAHMFLDKKLEPEHLAKYTSLIPADLRVKLHEVTDPAIITNRISPIPIEYYGSTDKTAPFRMMQVELGDDNNRFGGDFGFTPFFSFVAFTDDLAKLYKGYK